MDSGGAGGAWGGVRGARLPWTQLPVAKDDSAEKHLSACRASTSQLSHKDILVF